MNLPPLNDDHPDLNDEAVARICRPLKQPAAQLRYLTSIGVHAVRRPDGTVSVNKAHYNAVKAATPGELGGTDPRMPRFGVH